MLLTRSRENQEQTAEWKVAQIMQLVQKGNAYKVGSKESMVAEKIRDIKMRPSTLHWHNRRSAWGHLRNGLVHTHRKLMVIKLYIPLKHFELPADLKGTLFTEGCLEKSVPKFSSGETKKLLHTLLHGSLLLFVAAQASHRPWHLSCGAGFSGLCNAPAVESGRFLPT